MGDSTRPGSTRQDGAENRQQHERLNDRQRRPRTLGLHDFHGLVGIEVESTWHVRVGEIEGDVQEDRREQDPPHDVADRSEARDTAQG
jgi:hypothetical protein